MTTNCIAAEQDKIDCKDDRTDTDPKSVRKPERLPNIVRKNQKEQQREVKKVAVNILHDERKRTLAQITFAWLAYGACRRISPECFVVGAAIIVTGEAESARGPKNQ